jgi:hypothetical protein
MTVTEYPTGARVRTSSSASFFLFLSLFLLRYCVVSRRRRVLCVARIYSLGGGKAFGEKIIILRIKTSSSLFIISLSFSLSFSPTTTTSERERERERQKRVWEENDLVVSLFCGGGLK